MSRVINAVIFRKKFSISCLLIVLTFELKNGYSHGLNKVRDYRRLCFNRDELLIFFMINRNYTKIS